MVTIRLARTGANKKPFYHIVVSDVRMPQSGRSIERLGFFNPVARGAEERLRIDLDRVAHWQSQGAQATGRVADLVKAYRKQAAQTESAA
jgi:small subunit ribosomal protein S16